MVSGQSFGLHHLHVLSTMFSLRPFSSFSLWIILLPSDSRCFLLLRSNRFLSTLSSATPGFCAIAYFRGMTVVLRLLA